MGEKITHLSDQNRRTGRSTRMLEYAIEEARDGKRVMIVSALHAQQDMLLDMTLGMMPPDERKTVKKNRRDRTILWKDGGELEFKVFESKDKMDEAYRGWRGGRQIDHYTWNVWFYRWEKSLTRERGESNGRSSS